MSESQNNAIKRLRTNEALEEDLLQAEKENKRMADVVAAANKFKWPDAREAGKIWEELYQALQALNSDTYGVDGNGSDR